MKTTFKHEINYIAIVLALGSFCIGTLLLLCYKISGIETFITLGLNYTVIAVIVNSLVLLLLTTNAVIHYGDYKENLPTILVLLVNIPITFFYIQIVL